MPTTYQPEASPLAPSYIVTIGDHRCRPIKADDWRDALSVAIMRCYGPRAWSPSREIYNGDGYRFGFIDIYVSDTRNPDAGSHLRDSHVRATIVS